MKGTFGRIWAIALNTFREAARIRVLYGIVVLVIGVNLFSIVLGEMSVREQTRIARDIGLGLVERMPALKNVFIREAAGFTGDVPKLLRGEGL